VQPESVELLRAVEADMAGELFAAREARDDAWRRWLEVLRSCPPAPWSAEVCRAVDVAFHRIQATEDAVAALEAYGVGSPGSA
jgi:hypothetical protein